MIMAALAIVIITGTICGCCGVLGQQNGGKVNAVVTGNNTAISGTKGDTDEKQLSTSFPLTEGAYIVRSTNKGGPNNLFRGSLVSDKSNGTYANIWYPGTDYAFILIVGNTRGTSTVPEGTYHLQVASGGTYTVTVTKPVTGDILPVTITGAKNENVVKAINLTPGILAINLSYEVGYTNMASIKLYDHSGNEVNIKSLSLKDKSKESYTAAIANAGLYVISVNFPDNTGGQATLKE